MTALSCAEGRRTIHSWHATQRNSTARHLSFRKRREPPNWRVVSRKASTASPTKASRPRGRKRSSGGFASRLRRSEDDSVGRSASETLRSHQCQILDSEERLEATDRKSTRLNSSHSQIS